jgi:hypothetical protein
LAITQLTVPSRSYPVGVTSAIKALPNNQQYSTLQLSVDCSGWVSALTTLVNVAVEWSFDGGVTYRLFGSVSQIAPPPWTTKQGPTSTLTATFHEGTPQDPTHMRGSVTVAGQTVTIGPITLSAS